MVACRACCRARLREWLVYLSVGLLENAHTPLLANTFNRWPTRAHTVYALLSLTNWVVTWLRVLGLALREINQRLVNILNYFRQLAYTVRAESSFSLDHPLLLWTHVIINASCLRHLHNMFFLRKHFISLVRDFAKPNRFVIVGCFTATHVHREVHWLIKRWVRQVSVRVSVE